MRFRSVVKVVALIGVLAASTAVAQQVGDGAKTNPVGTKLSSVYMADSTGRVFRSDVDGNIYTVDADRDRNFPVITSLFSSVNLAQSSTYQQGTAIYIGQYSRASLMLRWSITAADSDSVRIAVRVYGKTSINSGTLHLWTPAGAGNITNDTCNTSSVAAADSGGGAGRCIAPVSFWISRLVGPYTAGAIVSAAGCSNLYSGAAVGGTGRVRIRRIPSYTWRPPGIQGVMLPLSDSAGNPCPFPYILVEVVNASPGSTLTSLSCDVWPRVN